MSKEATTVRKTAVGNIPSSNMRLGMILFLVSEAFLFGSLFVTYYYLRANSAVWPPSGTQLDSVLAGINTIILLSSSIFIWRARVSIAKGNEKGLVAGMVAVIILGTAFLGITVFEWAHETFHPWNSAYGSIFNMMTGFHALHVFAGVLLMLALLIRTLRHRFSSRNFQAVEIVSLYWHFVDFIWILVFTTIFVIR